MDSADDLARLHNDFPCNPRPELPVLVITAVSAEREAVLRGLRHNPRFVVLEGGAGPVASAVNTARAVAAAEYGLVVNAGIGGGFLGQADVGTLVVATEIVAADLGAETPTGFCSLEELGFGTSRIPIDLHLVKQVTRHLQAEKIPVQAGPVLTVSTVTGTAARGLELATRIPGAASEAMEGYGVGFAAWSLGLPVLEIRAISNLVGPRDRSAWRIPEALALLEAASSVLGRILE